MYNALIYIPSQKEKWNIRPYTTYHQKEICKSLYEDDNDLFIDNINDILVYCIHPKYNFKQLTLIDKILLILKIRCLAAGSTMEFETETEDKKKCNIKYNFNDIYNKINLITSKIEPLEINLKNIQIQFYIPSIHQENKINKFIRKKESISCNDIMHFFVNYININNNFLYSYDVDDLIIQQFVNNLPANIITKINSYIEQILNNFNEIIIYNIINKKINFTLLGELFTDYCKFIVKDNLHSIYQEIYILNKHINMSSEYIEKLTPIEREIYIASLRKENKISTENIPTSPQAVPIPQNNQYSSLDSIDTFKHTMGG